MSLLDQLKRVRCVSEFEDREIDRATLAEVIGAAGWAPSAADAQPWEIIAVADPERKAAIAGLLLDSLLRPQMPGEARRSWIVGAPLLLIVCLDHMRAKARFGEIGEKLFGIQDTGAAMQNMRLVALEKGIKSCLIREFDRARAAELLALPRHVEPLTMIAMGYSAVEPKPGPTLPLEDYLHFETW
jgi:nitroreductase